MEQGRPEQQRSMTRTFRGRDLGEAQRKAWEAQPDLFLAGYVSTGQQWDESKRTLTVRYELRDPVAQRREVAPSPSDEGAEAPTWQRQGRQADQDQAQADEQQPPTSGPPATPAPPQLRWADNPPLPRWRIVVAILIIAALGAGAVVALNLDVFEQRPKTVIPAGTDSGTVPRVEPATCRGLRLGTAMLRCGDLIVPEDRARPDGSRIRLHYAIHPAEGASKEPDPVVYLDGGPGASPLTDGFLTQPFVRQRDLVVFDQRGTGQSVPTLDCPEIDALPLDAGESDAALALRSCRDRLAVEGVDRAQYTSAESAADVEDLRTALGYPAWNLYGISYGTRLALTVMRDHPAGVRSSILDSVYPPNVDGYGDQAGNAERAFELLFGSCEQQPACAAAYPGLRATLDGAVDRLDRERPQVSVTPSGRPATDVTLDGDDLIDLVFQALYVTDAIPKLPRAIRAVAGGDYGPLAAMLADDDEPRDQRGRGDTKSEGMELSVQCSEELPFSRPEPEPASRTRLAQVFTIRAIQARCAFWQVPAAPVVEQEAVSSDIPALLLAGEFDPVTPPAWADLAAATLSRGHVVTFPGVAHGVLGSSACADGLVSAFLAAPMSEPDLRCRDSLPNLVFEVP